MERQKLLFSDLYRLLTSIKGNTKTMAKDIDNLLFEFADWDSATTNVTGLISTADRIRIIAESMMVLASGFLEGGPYEKQRAGTLPLETMAEEVSGDEC